MSFGQVIPAKGGSARPLSAHKYRESAGPPQVNQLPINFFHSASEYSKMLITHGKSVRNKSETPIEGFHDNLEFMNKPFFQSPNRIPPHRKNSTLQSTRKDSTVNECCCCCCDNFCQACVSSSQCKKIKQPRMAALEFKQVLTKVEKRLNESKKKKKLREITQIETELRSGGSRSKIREHVRKGEDIENLICKSLILMEEKKREVKIAQIRKTKEQQERKEHLRSLNQQIRTDNLERCRSGAHSSSKSKPHTKSQTRLQYWSSIKDQVAKALRNKSQVPKHRQEKKWDYFCRHQSALTLEQIERLRAQHEKEAKEKIQQQKKLQQDRKKKIKKGVKSVIAQQNKAIQEMPKRKFEPSPEVIEKAFTNLA